VGDGLADLEGMSGVLKRPDEALRSHDAKPVALAGAMASGEYRT
jgi:hypothetical protein